LRYFGVFCRIFVSLRSVLIANPGQRAKHPQIGWH